MKKRKDNVGRLVALAQFMCHLSSRQNAVRRTIMFHLCVSCQSHMRRVSQEYHPEQDVLASSYVCLSCTTERLVTEKRNRPIWFCLRHIKVAQSDTYITAAAVEKSPQSVWENKTKKEEDHS